MDKHDSDSDDGVGVFVINEDAHLDEIWEKVVVRWKAYVSHYSLEMLDDYDEEAWSNHLTEWISHRSKVNDGWN